MKKYNVPTIEMLVISTTDDVLLGSGEQPIINGLDNLEIDDF